MSKKLISFYKNTLFIFYSIFQYESRAVTSIYGSALDMYSDLLYEHRKNIVVQKY